MANKAKDVLGILFQNTIGAGIKKAEEAGKDFWGNFEKRKEEERKRAEQRVVVKSELENLEKAKPGCIAQWRDFFTYLDKVQEIEEFENMILTQGTLPYMHEVMRDKYPITPIASILAMDEGTCKQTLRIFVTSKYKSVQYSYGKYTFVPRETLAEWAEFTKPIGLREKQWLPLFFEAGFPHLYELVANESVVQKVVSSPLYQTEAVYNHLIPRVEFWLWGLAQQETGFAEFVKHCAFERGKRGEVYVDYLINKWAERNNSITIQKTCSNYYSTACIWLAAWKVFNKPQEFDHLIVTPIGVIHLETKEYHGIINVIDTNNWVQISYNGKGKGIESPAGQVRQHEKVLRGILGNNIPIHSVIVLGDADTKIRYTQKSDIPICSIRVLYHYLSTLINTTPTKLSNYEMKVAKQAIEAAKVDRKD